MAQDQIATESSSDSDNSRAPSGLNSIAASASVLPLDAGLHSDRCRARRIDRSEERALGRGFIKCARVVDRDERTIEFIAFAIGQRFDRERALSAGWNEIARVELDELHIVDSAEPFQSRHRDYDRVEARRRRRAPNAYRRCRAAAESRVRDSFLSAWKRRRDDDVPSRAPAGSADSVEPSRVTRMSDGVLALRDGSDAKLRSAARRGDLSSNGRRASIGAIGERLLELLDEESLAADIRERGRRHLVAAGAYLDDFNFDSGNLRSQDDRERSTPARVPVCSGASRFGF